MLATYIESLTLGKTVLWCYLLWYLVSVLFHFDASPSIWMNSIGLSVVIGIALMLSVNAASNWKKDKWPVIRLFIMPFCVSSFSALTKNEGYFLILPPSNFERGCLILVCVLFLALVYKLKKSKKFKPVA